jgi:hypothetical protein
MARRKSTRKARLRRKSGARSHRPARERALDRVSSLALVTPLVTSDGAIETQRTQLRRARAVLDCLHFVLLYEDQFEDSERPSYSDAVEVAREIVSAAIEGLDLVNLSRSARRSHTPIPSDLGAPHPSTVESSKV